MRSPSPIRRRLMRRVADHLIGHGRDSGVRVVVTDMGDAGRRDFADALAGQVRAGGRTVARVAFGSAAIDPPPSVVIADAAVSARIPDGAWDHVVFLDAGHELPPDERAAVARDATSRARDAADVVVDNGDPDEPMLVRIGGPHDTDVRVFAYGDLLSPGVHEALFGRALVGVADALVGHRVDHLTVDERRVVAVSGSRRHAIARASRRVGDTVDGSVLTLTTTDLAAADSFLVHDYRRCWVTLASHEHAWSYTASDSRP